MTDDSRDRCDKCCVSSIYVQLFELQVIDEPLA